MSAPLPPLPILPAAAAACPAGQAQALLDVSLTGLLLLRPLYRAPGSRELTDFVLEYANPAGQRMLRVAPAESRTMLALFPNTQGTGVLAFYRRVFESGEAGRYDINYAHDGLDNYFMLTAARSGELLAVSITDTTDHGLSLVEEALRQSQAREQANRIVAEAQRGELQRLFEQAPVAVAVFRGPRFVIEWANAAVCAMWGRTSAQAHGTPLFELLPEAAGQGFEQLLEGVLVTGVAHVAHELPSQIERQGRRQTVYWSFIYQPLRGADEQVSGIIVVATDVTEQVVARRQVLALNQELATAVEELHVLNAGLEQRVQERTRALLATLALLEQRGQELAQALAAEQELGGLKSRFVTMASHEFRTPLTVVLTSAALIQKYPEREQQRLRLKHLSRIRASVQHLNDILEEFLAVGQLEDGSMRAHPADDVSLAALLDEAEANVRSLRKAGQLISRELSGPALMRLDPSLLRKILVNLLANALKYSGENTTVSIRASCRRQVLTLRVRDQGIGIAEEDQPRLFERFYRARNVSAEAGTGLGLYITARYVALMGGTIALQSTLGQGTTLTLTLPYDAP